MRSHIESPTENGLYTLWIDTYDPVILRHIVDPEIPNVVLENHLLSELTAWFEAVIPISEATLTSPRKQLVRGVTMDLQMPTIEFIARIAEFERFDSMDFYQLDAAPEDTLNLTRVNPGARRHVYRQSGVKLHFTAPRRLCGAMAASIEQAVILRLSARLERYGNRPLSGTG